MFSATKYRRSIIVVYRNRYVLIRYMGKELNWIGLNFVMYWSYFFSHFVSLSLSLSPLPSHSILFLRSAMRHTSHINVEHCLVSISVSASVRARALHLHLCEIFCVILDSLCSICTSIYLWLQMKSNVNNMQQTFSSNTIRSISVYNWHFPFALFCVFRVRQCGAKSIDVYGTHFSTCWLFFFFFFAFCHFLFLLFAEVWRSPLCFLSFRNAHCFWFDDTENTASLFFCCQSASFRKSVYTPFFVGCKCVSLAEQRISHSTLSTFFFQCQFFCLDYLHESPKNWSTQNFYFSIFSIHFEWTK